MRQSIKARATKSGRRGVSRMGGKKKTEGGSTWRTAGPVSQGSSSGSGHIVNVILSTHLLEMQQPKLCSNLTFQKHRLIQLSCLSLLHHPPLSSPLWPFPSVLFYHRHLFLSHILNSYYISFFHIPAIFLSITLPHSVSFSHDNCPSISLFPFKMWLSGEQSQSFLSEPLQEFELLSSA